MKVIRARTKLMIMVCNEAERQLVDRLFHRALNTWEPQPPALLAAHELLKAPLRQTEQPAQQGRTVVEPEVSDERRDRNPGGDAFPSDVDPSTARAADVSAKGLLPAVAVARAPTIVPLLGAAEHFARWWDETGNAITNRYEIAQLAFDEGHSTHHAESSMPDVFRSNRTLPARVE